jgi:hypothetical protein
VESQLGVLRSEIEQLSTERDRYRELYLRMLETCKKLERGLVGQKAERPPRDEAQLSLQLLETLLGESSPAPETPEFEAPTRSVRAHERRRPTGRQVLPEHLPRVEIEVLPDEVKRDCSARSSMRAVPLRGRSAGPRPA